MTQVFKISLNSFVRRTEHTNQLKALIDEAGATLSRKGRSRNWTLSSTKEQAIQVRHAIEAANQSSWLWLAKALEIESPRLTTDELRSIADKHWPVTVTTLMAITDCTSAQARTVIDDIEWGQ